jgi:hypothetical protein
MIHFVIDGNGMKARQHDPYPDRESIADLLTTRSTPQLAKTPHAAPI